MQMNGKPVTFQWRNYTKPTPHNLKMFMEFWKGLIVVISSLTIFENANQWVSITIIVIGYALDRLAKFFAHVEEEQAKESVTIEYPADVSDQVTITKDKVETKPEHKQ